MGETVHPGAPSLAPVIYIVVSVVVLLAFILLVVRLWVKLRMTEAGLGKDDWSAIVAMTLSIALAGLNIAQTWYGWGYHLKDLSPSVDVDRGWAIFYVMQVVYCNALTAVKISILLLILRIMPPLRLAIYVLLAFIGAVDIAITMALIFQCRPVQYAWDSSYEKGYCINFEALYIFNGLTSIVTEVIIYGLPIHRLWKIPDFTFRQKIGLALVFSVGALAVLASGLWLNSLAKTSISLDDAQWNSTGVIIWSSVEINIAIMCACLACLKPLVVRAFGAKRGANRSKPDATEMSPYITLREIKLEEDEEKGKTNGQTSNTSPAREKEKEGDVDPEVG